MERERLLSECTSRWIPGEQIGARDAPVYTLDLQDTQGAKWSEKGSGRHNRVDGLKKTKATV